MQFGGSSFLFSFFFFKKGEFGGSENGYGYGRLESLAIQLGSEGQSL
jgi:hypothetical protein